MRVFIDTCSAQDFDKVARYLFDRGIDVSERNKIKLEIIADVSDEIIAELRNLDLDNVISIGTKSLFREPKYGLSS